MEFKKHSKNPENLKSCENWSVFLVHFCVKSFFDLKIFQIIFAPIFQKFLEKSMITRRF